MVTVNHQGIILHINIIVLHQRCLNCSECFQRHLMFYTCNTNIRVTHRNGAIKHIFTRIRSTEGSSADCSLFILSLRCACSSSSEEILLQIFLYEDFMEGCLFYIISALSCISRMPAGTSTCYANYHY